MMRYVYLCGACIAGFHLGRAIAMGDIVTAALLGGVCVICLLNFYLQAKEW